IRDHHFVRRSVPVQKSIPLVLADISADPPTSSPGSSALHASKPSCRRSLLSFPERTEAETGTGLGCGCKIYTAAEGGASTCGGDAGLPLSPPINRPRIGSAP